MSVEKTAEKFLDLIHKYIALKPKLILPKHVLQFKKKMEGLKSKMEDSGGSPEDRSFLFRILILLAQSAALLTMSELSTELNVPMSTATRIVDGLVRIEMVERATDPNDRRVVRIGLSMAGRRLYEEGMNFNKQRITRLLKDFSNDEQEQLLKLMTKLFDSLASESDKQK